MLYEDFVEAHFDVKNRYGKEVMVLCIFHDDSNASLQINLETGLFICFSCGASGGPRALYGELGLAYPTDMEDDLSVVIRQLDNLERKERRPSKQTIYPESYLDRFKMDTGYWAKRDISPATVQRFGLGFDLMGNYVTIPMRNINGELLGVCKRYMHIVDSPTGKRYKYPAGFQRRENLFAAHLIAEDETARTVALVEGALDTAKVWQAGWHAAGIYGNAISAHQIRLLVRCGVEVVILFFDNDSGGRKAHQSCLGFHTNKRKGEEVVTYNPALDLRKHFDLYAVTWPKKPLPSVQDGSEDAKDPGALSSGDIQRLLQTSTGVP